MFSFCQVSRIHILGRVSRRRTLKYEFTFWHGACMNLRETRKNLTTLAKTNTRKSYKMCLLICPGNCRSSTNGRSTEILSSPIISGVRLLTRIQSVISFLDFIKLSVCWQRVITTSQQEFFGGTITN